MTPGFERGSPGGRESISFGYLSVRSVSAHPEHVRILEVRLRVTLLGVDKVRELGGVADEEHGRVVEHPVEVALLSLDLDGETCPFALNSYSETESNRWRRTTRITRRVRGTGLATDGRETDGQGRLLADGVEERRAGKVGDIVRRLEVSVRTRTLSVHDTLCASPVPS